jgi:hypothetical protein
MTLEARSLFRRYAQKNNFCLQRNRHPAAAVRKTECKPEKHFSSFALPQLPQERWR